MSCTKSGENVNDQEQQSNGPKMYNWNLEKIEGKGLTVLVQSYKIASEARHFIQVVKHRAARKPRIIIIWCGITLIVHHIRLKKAVAPIPG